LRPRWRLARHRRCLPWRPALTTVGRAAPSRPQPGPMADPSPPSAWDSSCSLYAVADAHVANVSFAGVDSSIANGHQVERHTDARSFRIERHGAMKEVRRKQHEQALGGTYSK